MGLAPGSGARRRYLGCTSTVPGDWRSYVWVRLKIWKHMRRSKGRTPVSRERLLIHTLLELADTMVVDHDVVEFLYLLCERTLQVVEVDGAGVLLMSDRGTFEVAAASDHEMHQLEESEAVLGRGPCVEAHRTGERVDQGDLSDAARWPDFAAQAVAVGFRSAHARPLRLRGRPFGALTVVRKSPGVIDEDSAVVVAGLADMASIGIVHERTLSAAQQQIGHLQRALEKRAVVDQAMAVLAERADVEHGDAFAWLRRYSRDHNLRLREVAQRFLDGELDARSLVPR